MVLLIQGDWLTIQINFSTFKKLQFSMEKIDQVGVTWEGWTSRIWRSIECAGIACVLVIWSAGESGAGTETCGGSGTGVGTCCGTEIGNRTFSGADCEISWLLWELFLKQFLLGIEKYDDSFSLEDTKTAKLTQLKCNYWWLTIISAVRKDR